MQVVESIGMAALEDLMECAVRTLMIDALAAGLDIFRGTLAVEIDRAKIPGCKFTQAWLDGMRTKTLEEAAALIELALGRCEIDFRATRQADADSLLTLYERIDKYTKVALGVVHAHKVLTHSPEGQSLYPTCKTVDDAVGRFKLCMGFSSVCAADRKLLSRHLRLRFETVRLAEPALRRLQGDVQEHVAARKAKGRCLLLEVADDVLLQIGAKLNYRAAAACLRCCRHFAQSEQLRELLPHLSIRHLPGALPHEIAPENGSEVGFLARGTLAHTYVDLVITGEARDDADSVRLQTTPVHAALPPAWQTYALRSEQKKARKDEAERDARLADEEAVGEGRFRRRLSHECFFATPLRCTAELVFADTHTAVPGHGGFPATSLPRWMLKKAPTATYTSEDGVPYPAHCAFAVDTLSSAQLNRKFKVKVTGVATTLRNAADDPGSEYEQRLVAFSKSFKVISNRKVAEGMRARAKAGRGKSR